MKFYYISLFNDLFGIYQFLRVRRTGVCSYFIHPLSGQLVDKAIVTACLCLITIDTIYCANAGYSRVILSKVNAPQLVNS